MKSRISMIMAVIVHLCPIEAFSVIPPECQHLFAIRHDVTELLAGPVNLSVYPSYSEEFKDLLDFERRVLTLLDEVSDSLTELKAASEALQLRPKQEKSARSLLSSFGCIKLMTGEIAFRLLKLF